MTTTQWSGALVRVCPLRIATYKTKVTMAHHDADNQRTAAGDYGEKGLPADVPGQPRDGGQDLLCVRRADAIIPQLVLTLERPISFLTGPTPEHSTRNTDEREFLGRDAQVVVLVA